MKTRLPIEVNTPAFQTVDSIPVGGDFAITAILPTLQNIVDWQEGKIELEHGYFRFVDSPILKTLQESISQHYHLRNALAYTSQETAFYELFHYLSSKKKIQHIQYVSDLSAEEQSVFTQKLHSLSIEVEIQSPAKFDEGSPLTESLAQVMIFALRDPLAFFEKHQQWLQQCKKKRISVVVYASEFLPKVELPAIGYWIFPLSVVNSPSMIGGILLSNIDRAMAELLERRKIRGPILSSRNAKFFMNQEIARPTIDSSTAILEELCHYENAKAGLLYPSGMNAISTLLDLAISKERPQMIIIGHLYADTHSLLAVPKKEANTPENIFLSVHELDQLESSLTEYSGAIMTESITNPLNDVPDLAKIAEIAQKYHIPLLVDNTCGTPLNCQPMEYGADYVIHSTTKYLSGNNAHTGGVILFRKQENYSRFAKHQSHWKNTLSPLEANNLFQCMQDFPQRMERFHQNAQKVATFLENHPAVKSVYYCGLTSHSSFANASTLLKQGFGAIVSFVLQQEDLETLRKFYDSLPPAVTRAPSLGSNQTLLCPYTLLTHYHESDETLKEFRMPRYLIRIAVGSEHQIQPVIDALEVGLSVE